jgi:hypothetical protein
MTDQTDTENKLGRPSVVTGEKIALLKAAFLFGASDKEACAYAEISKDSLYRYQSSHPDFSEQKEAWKENPILKAKETVFRGVQRDPDLALRYLERKKKDEFSLRNELSGPNGEPLSLKIEDFTE